MATDATGTPTTLGIPKFNTSNDAPSGLGFNAAMDEIDTLIAGRIALPAAPSVGQALIWDGTSWVSQKMDATRVSYRSVSLTRSAVVAIPTAAMTTIDWDLEGWDSSAYHDAGAPSRITIPAGGDGLYSFNLWIPWQASGVVSRRFVHILKNGTETIVRSEIPNTTGSPEVNNTASILHLAVAGDYFEVQVYQNSGGSLNIQRASATDVRPRFQAALIGTA